MNTNTAFIYLFFYMSGFFNFENVTDDKLFVKLVVRYWTDSSYTGIYFERI